MDRRRAEAFRVLGIPADSDADAVLHAYRRLARATHPDVSTDPEAADRFAALAAAYRVASHASSAPADSADSPARSGMRYEDFAHRSDPIEDEQTAEWAPWWGSVSGWPVPLGSTPKPRQRQDAPIVAGPVFISPARRTGYREGRRG